MANIFFMLPKTRFMYVVLLILTLVSCNEKSKLPFNKAGWDSDINIRHQMLADIVESKIILHKSTSGVVNILGEPAIKWDSINRWMYDAGAAAEGFGVTFYHLYLTFKDGIVDSVRISEYHD